MPAVAKKSLTYLVLAFAVFYLFTQPAHAADAVRGAVEGLNDAFAALIHFFSRLAS